jgi:hypothetical protein
VLVLVLALVVTPRPVLAFHPRLVLLAILVLPFSGQSVTKCPGLPHWKHVLVFLLMFTRFSCSLSNLLVSNAISSSPST